MGTSLLHDLLLYVPDNAHKIHRIKRSKANKEYNPEDGE